MFRVYVLMHAYAYMRRFMCKIAATNTQSESIDTFRGMKNKKEISSF